ncbi:unnamed protein product [Auanema sp. JU1783]|nr:unnamed protein product [Auanema sp. JU1783]
MYSNDELDNLPKLNKMIPKHIQDVVSIGTFVILMPLGFLIHLFYIMPTWWPAFGEAWVIRTSIFGFLAFNVYVNWFRMIQTGPNGSKAVLVDIVKSGYRFCHSCRANAPPRAYHCPVCDACQFRRDHHCSFGAVCIGHFNQRYFVGAILNLFALQTVLSLYAWEFLWLNMDGQFTILKAWQIVLPHLALVARILSFYQFVVVLFYACNMTVLLFTLYLIAAQAFCIWQGQTRVEYLLDVHAYQIGVFGNLKECLGSRWPLIALSPFIPSPLPSDGTSFSVREIPELSRAKDM